MSNKPATCVFFTNTVWPLSLSWTTTCLFFCLEFFNLTAAGTTTALPDASCAITTRTRTKILNCRRHFKYYRKKNEHLLLSTHAMPHLIDQHEYIQWQYLYQFVFQHFSQFQMMMNIHIELTIWYFKLWKWTDNDLLEMWQFF